MMGPESTREPTSLPPAPPRPGSERRSRSDGGQRPKPAPQPPLPQPVLPPGPGSSWSGGVPTSAGDAAAMVLAGLSWLANADAASMPAAVHAACLRDLERAQSVHLAARSKILEAFAARRGYEDDGQGSPRTWLTWQTRITRPAASTALSWTRRLGDHPAIARALAEGVLSVSWARQLADWTDQLPVAARGDADLILLAAAAAGADLAALAELAEEIRARTASPDADPGDGFAHRGLRLDTTLGGAGRLNGDLSARCAAALRAVLDSLGKRHGPEDVRTVPQRDHDALEEACRRLLAAGCLPDRAGQPVQLQLHLTLDQLLNGIPGPAVLPRPAPRWPASPHGGPLHGGPVPAGTVPARPGDDCDAALAPIVTGRIDHDLAAQLAGKLAARWAEYDPDQQSCQDRALAGCAGAHGRGDIPGRDPADGENDNKAAAAREQREDMSRAAARELILRHAVALLSGPTGLAAWLRTGALPPPASTVSLPLDTGTVTDLVPPHLRRAIITRDRRCAAPGCDTPPAACHVHHIIPRSQGGTTSLTNCLLLCAFHHLIMIHRWGWTIALNADGTTTMTSPHGRVLHSHSPPTAA